MKKSVLFFVLFLFLNFVGVSQNYNNWLGTLSVGATVNFSEPDISGNQNAEETTINKTQFYVSFGSDHTEGDIISKHTPLLMRITF